MGHPAGQVGYFRWKRAWPMEKNGAVAGILLRGICPIPATGALFPPIAPPAIRRHDAWALRGNRAGKRTKPDEIRRKENCRERA